MVTDTPWKMRSLGELADFRNGVNYERKNFGKGVRIVGVRDFQDYFKPRYEELEEIDPRGVVDKDDLIQNDDIIFVRSNGNRGLIGRSLFIEHPPADVTHSAFTIRVRFTSREVFPKFYAYLFRTALIRDMLTAHGGGTNISNLTQDVLKNLKVPMPSMPVQRQIASALSAYDNLIDLNARRVKILDEMARVIYHEWFVNFNIPGSSSTNMESQVSSEFVPVGWEVKKLGDVVQLSYGKGLKSSNRMGGPFPVYGSSGIIGYHNVPLVQGPGVIVGRKGNVGSVFWSSDSFFPIDTVFYVQTGISLPYVYYNLLSQNFINKDAAVPGLGRSQAYLNSFMVPAPKVLKAFETFVGPIMELIDNTNKSNSSLRQARDLILPRLFRGEFDTNGMGTLDVARLS